MDKMDLPQDLIDFLKSGKQLSYDPEDCEPGQIILLPFEELTLGEVYIDSEGSPFADKDPHTGEKGYYAVPAVNLVVECDGFDPEGVLIWLPEQKMFGTWDCDHWNTLVFPEITWTDIVANPIKFINAQWEPGGLFLRPFPRYSFNLGDPWGE